MLEYHVKLSANGRITLPLKVRKKLHLMPNDELILRVVDNEVQLTSVDQALKKAQALVQQYSKKRSLVDKLFEMRKEEGARE